MSRAEKRAPFQADPELEAAEARRREELAANGAYRRGVALAEAQERMNAQSALETALADLKRCALKRDTTQAARDAYDRCHGRVVKAAERVASVLVGSIGAGGKVITDPEIIIPAWIPPPVPTATQTVAIGAPRGSTAYRETKGRGPSGGLPLRGPGSNTDPDWMNK